MKFQRVFTKKGFDPDKDIKWVKRDSKISEPSGKIIFEMKDIEVPEHWSQIAIDILVQKYFRKSGVPNFTVFETEESDIPLFLRKSLPDTNKSSLEFTSETSAKQVFHRLAGCYAYWGWKAKYFDTEKDAKIFYDEIYYMLVMQIAAPNSPAWFNVGLNWAYGITGPAQGHYYVDFLTGEVKLSEDAYTHPQPHACFIQSINDHLVAEGGIMDLWHREARLFKYGSGSGTNFSSLRGKGEKLEGGGVSSGLMSFLEIGDRTAGAIQSGGTCLSYSTPVLTEKGWQQAKDLINKSFVVFSRNLETGKVVAKHANAFVSGYKEVCNVYTDKGIYKTSVDHPFLTKSNSYITAENLRKNDRLNKIITYVDWDGYPCITIPPDYNSSERIHRKVAELYYGDITGKVVHHKNENKLDASPNNLEVFLPSEHASLHSSLLPLEFKQRRGSKSVRIQKENGIHAFTNRKFPKKGARNGMHKSSEFWKDEKKAKAYKEKHRQANLKLGKEELRRRQKLAAKSRLLNNAYFIIEKTKSNILTFEEYYEKRKEAGFTNNAGKEKIYTIINRSFGSYSNFLTEINRGNCKVIRIEKLGAEPVIDIQVDCASLENRTVKDHHNFLIGPQDSKDWDKRHGVFVHNTRRAAKMVVVDIDHPEIEDFINWKVKEEQKVAALVIGSKLCNFHLNNIMKEYHRKDKEEKIEDRFYKHSERYEETIKDAIEAGIPRNYIERVKQLCKEGYKEIEFSIYDTEWNGEAYHTVSGQNSNNSIRIPDSFMQRIDNEKWELKNRTDGKVSKVINSKELWDQICYAAWSCADPGIHFSDTINDWNTCKNDGEIFSSNPCAEYFFLNETACNLSSLNLVKFYDSERDEFNIEEFKYACHLWTIVLDISVTMAQFPSKKIAEKSYEYRTLGLGYANLGALLMRIGLAYESEEARAYAASITALMHLQSYLTSSLLARELSPFPRYKFNEDSVLEVIDKHVSNILGISETSRNSFLIKEIKKLGITLLQSVKTYGVRNAQVTCIAPTGTIGLVMSCDTTGVEPDYALVKFKKLAGGGYLKIVNQSVPAALKKLGYKEDQIIDIINYIVGVGKIGKYEGKIKEALLSLSTMDENIAIKIINEMNGKVKNTFNIQLLFSSELLEKFSKKELEEMSDYMFGHMTIEGAPFIKETDLSVFDCANKQGKYGKRVIPWQAHIKMLAAIQPFLSGASSKTINLPNSATIEDVSSVYKMAWKLGVKAIALYRDGSKLSQPLMSSYIEDERKDLVKAKENNDVVEIAKNLVSNVISKRRLLPNRRNGYTQKAKIAGQTIYLRTGEYEDGTLGEIFIDMHKEGAIVRSLLNSFAIAVSLGLQHGVPLEELIEAFVFSKFEPSGIVTNHSSIRMATSVIDYIFRDLAINYLGKEELAHIPINGNNNNKNERQFIKLNENIVDRNTQERDGKINEEFTENSFSVKVLNNVDWKELGFTGDICNECQSATMVRNGTCLKCVTCGATSGCS